MPKVNKDIKIDELKEHFRENFVYFASLVFEQNGYTDKSLKEIVVKLMQDFYDKKNWKYSLDVNMLMRVFIDGYYFGSLFWNLSEVGVIHHPGLYSTMTSTSFEINQHVARWYNFPHACGRKFQLYLLSSLKNNYKNSREFPFLTTMVVQRKMIGKVLEDPAFKKRKLEDIDPKELPNVRFTSFDYLFEITGMTDSRYLGYCLIKEGLEAYFTTKGIRPVKFYGPFVNAKKRNFCENLDDNDQIRHTNSGDSTDAWDLANDDGPDSYNSSDDENPEPKNDVTLGSEIAESGSEVFDKADSDSINFINTDSMSDESDPISLPRKRALESDSDSDYEMDLESCPVDQDSSLLTSQDNWVTFFSEKYPSCFGHWLSKGVFEKSMKGEMTYKICNELLELKNNNTDEGFNKGEREIRRIVDKVTQEIDRTGAVTTFFYCSCLMTIFNELPLETPCPNCGLMRDNKLKFSYIKLQARITTMMLNPQLFEYIMDARSAVYEGEFLNGIQNGELYLESLAAERRETEALRAKNIDKTVIYLSIGIAGDGVNLRRKGYKGIFPIIVVFMDLPLKLRVEQTFVHVPMVTETIKQTPGYLARMFQPFIEELTLLSTTGMELKIGGRDYLVKVRVISITGDIIAINQFTETLSPTSKHPCTYCTIPLVGNRIYFLDRSPGWQEKSREDRKLSWDHITTENVVEMIENGDFYTDTRGRSRQDAKWRVKAESLVSKLKCTDGWKVLVSDYMHVFLENILSKSITEILSNVCFSKIHPASYAMFQESRKDLLTEMISLGLFEEEKSAEQLFTIAATKSAMKATDYLTASSAFSALFRFLYQANGDATNVPDENGVETSRSPETSSQSFGHLQEAQLARPLLNNSFNNDSLTSMKLAAENGGVVVGEVESQDSFVPPDQSNCFQVFSLNDTNVTGESITINAESDFSVSRRAARARDKREKDAADRESFEHVVYMLIELNQFLRLLGAMDVPRNEMSNEGINRLKKAYVHLMEDIQLQSEVDGFGFLDELFRLPAHLVLHMIVKWPLFVNFRDNWCFVTERSCKKVKSLVRPVGGMMNTLNKRIKVDFLFDCISIFAHTGMHLSHIHCPKRKAEDPSKLPDEVSYFKEVFPDCGEFKIRPSLHMQIHGSIINLEVPGKEFAKIKIDGSNWMFVEITSIFRIDHDDVQEILLYYKPATVNYQWEASRSKLYDFCLASFIKKQTDVDTRKMFLTNDIKIHSVTALSDGFIIDKNPAFRDLARM